MISAAGISQRQAEGAPHSCELSRRLGNVASKLRTFAGAYHAPDDDPARSMVHLLGILNSEIPKLDKIARDIRVKETA